MESSPLVHNVVRPPRPRLGLALGGGGARGFAHIGVIQALEAAGLPIDLVVGTSMGAVIGSAYLCGVNLEKLVKLLQHLDLHELLGVPYNALSELVERTTAELVFKRVTWRREDSFKTRRLLEFFSLLSHRKRFEDLERPCAVVAADLDTGEQVVIDSGPIARALAASSALPGLHDPILWNGRLLVDGGIINKVPVSVAMALGADVVVAVDVSAHLAAEVHSSLGVLAQAVHITSTALVRTQLALMDEKLKGRLVVLHPPVANIRTLELNNVVEPVAAGRREAEAALPLIRRALEAARKLGR